ncbi:MAG: UDP-N-acetylmuramoyl-L-alanine--D-glutamate ligase [Rhodovarius sp.]|nr:UDP-N-acetylmuramoyl-L-alanine--D-glutamate ligase [Rhodovarius sp.]MDW8314757.1 UDP-N-acetylmuramoyl-L-alanine--D-glutamate ligase [Rhodovarius sp.]
MRHLAGRRIAVVGLGKAGLPAALRLIEWGAEVIAWDDAPAARSAAEAAGLKLAPPEELGRFDALLLSPGIPHRLPRPHPAAEAARAQGAPILCDVEFLHGAAEAAGGGVVFAGITGTNGKSTTTALLGHLLQAAGRTVAVGGNLGPAALALPLLPAGGVYVLEMSSYMLERIEAVRFKLAAMLNLSPDHLDRHGDMAGYAAAKARIFRRQQPEDLAVLGDDDAWTRAMRPPGRIRRISGEHATPGGVWFDPPFLRDDAGCLLDLREARALPGAHNAQNAAAAAAMALELGLPRDLLAAAIARFPGLPHRHEEVAEIRGVRFINDSKATNADSAARALAAHRRVVWIAGGIGKEGGIEPLAPFFPRIAHAVLIGRDGPAFAATLARHGVPHSLVATLEEAVPAAADRAFAGAADVVLLSPAAASWDQFSGFDQRGDRFRALVLALAGQEDARWK